VGILEKVQRLLPLADRIESLQSFMNENPAQPLAARGNVRLAINPDFSRHFPKMACKARVARPLEESSKKQSVILSDRPEC